MGSLALGIVASTPRSSPGMGYPFDPSSPSGDDPPILWEEVDGKLGPDYEATLVTEALSKTSAERTIDDCEAVQRAVSHVRFFRNMNDAAQVLGLCRVMMLRDFAKGDHIFNQGDTGYTFYVVYSGKVRVFVNDYKSGKEGIGAHVATLEMGDTFGELALLGNGLRAATVVAAGPTQLLEIEKDSYDRACARSYHEKIKRRVAFLKKVYLFGSWSDEALAELAKRLTEKKFEKNQTIIRQGTNTDCMYFVMSGRCRVLKQLGLSSSMAHKLATSLYETRSTMCAAAVSPASLQRDDPVLEIGELKRNQYFGEKALLDAKRLGKIKCPHTASVASITPVDILVLSKYDFYHQIDAGQEAMMQEYADKFYYTDEQLRRSIEQQHRWDSYKSGLLSDRNGLKHL